MRRVLGLVLIGALAGAPASARADDFQLTVFEKGMSCLALQLGRTGPTHTSGFDEMVKAGPAVGVQYLRYVNDWIALGAELDYFMFGSNGFVTGNGIELKGKASTMHLGVLARINIFEERSWTPYVLGGVGYNRTSLSVESDTPYLNTYTGETQSSTSWDSTDLTYTTGGGVEAFLLHDFSVSGEFRYHQFRFRKDFFWTEAGSLEALTFLVGFHYWFGVN